MPTDSSITIKICRNDSVLKNISEPVELNAKNWTSYMKSVKTIQKNVNTYLTELVEQEKSAGENANIEEEECGDSDDEEEDDSVKRKSDSLDEKSRKKAKV